MKTYWNPGSSTTFTVLDSDKGTVPTSMERLDDVEGDSEEMLRALGMKTRKIEVRVLMVVKMLMTYGDEGWESKNGDDDKGESEVNMKMRDGG